MVDTGTKSGKAAFAASLGVVLAGASVLAGWFFDWERVKRILPGLIAMNPVSAVAFILAGSALALFLLPTQDREQKRRVSIRAARLCALGVSFIGIAKLIGILGGPDIGLDRWLFSSKLHGDLHFPNSMAPNAALNFFLIGTSLFFVNSQKRAVRFCVEYSVGVAGILSLLAVLGYIYSLESYYRVADFVPLALHTAIVFCLLAIAFLLSHTDNGLLAVFAGKTQGGRLARRLMPAVIFIPALFGWLELRGESAGIYGNGGGNAGFVIVNCLVFLCLVGWSSRKLSDTDRIQNQTVEVLRESENSLKTSQTLARMTGRLNQMGAWSVELPGSTVFFSDEVCAIHEVPPGFRPPVGEAIDFYAPEYREAISTAFALCVRDGTPYEMESEIITARGRRIWVRSMGEAQKDEAGVIQRVQGACQDITERKRSDLIVERLAAIVENSDDAIISKNMDGLITSWNPAAEKMFGYTLAEAIDQPMSILSPPGREEEDSALDVFVKGTVVRHLETVRVRKDGQHIEVSTTISPLKDSTGQIIGASKIVRDITGRKRFEAQLIQSQRLETVGKLAGGVAHEFNSILTSIIGQTQLILDTLPPQSALNKNVAQIRLSSEKAAVLTRQLLAYGRRQFLQPRSMDLNLVLGGMKNTLDHLMGRQVEVRIIPAPALALVRMDPEQMEQVIINIAMNAASAMAKDGTLTLETTNTTLDEGYAAQIPDLKPGKYVALSISDTGTGMSLETQKHIFEPFFSTKGIGQGAGLGLATCYGIIKQSGGHINVYSELFIGSTFKIYLPQAGLAELIPTGIPAISDLPQGTETILLVEDDSVLRKLAETMLKRLGYTVQSAANGVEALSLCQQPGIGPIDLVFTDTVMPHMSGRELATRILEQSPSVKVLFTSAYTENSIVHQGMLDNGVAILQKPFTPGALAHKVREVLDQPGAAPPPTSQKTFDFTKTAMENSLIL